MTVQESKEWLDRPVESGDAAAPQLTAAARDSSSQHLTAPDVCSRCGNIRPLTHRVRSDVVEQTVCEACAAEVPLLITGVGELTVERIRPSENVSNARPERDL